MYHDGWAVMAITYAYKSDLQLALRIASYLVGVNNGIVLIG